METIKISWPNLEEIKREREVIFFSCSAGNEGMTQSNLYYKNETIISNKAIENSFQFEPWAVALENLFL